jgi:hypothetical protein
MVDYQNRLMLSMFEWGGMMTILGKWALLPVQFHFNRLADGLECAGLFDVATGTQGLGG